jgi:peptide methionine sulfoxide reductase msrA/msrB
MIEQTRELTPEEKLVIIHKGTEPPFSGKYYRHNETGTYHCRNCQAPLFASDHKFDSNCGWPSFDDALPEAVLQRPDTDGHRTEIICAACEGHLGHVFFGEQLTEKDTRHCINSISLNFVPRSEAVAQATAYFAGGCFWGVEYYLGKAEGVLATQVGYMGGSTDSPSYKDVCAGQTGHAEAVEVVFDPSVMSYDELTRLFFEIHDPTQVDRQGPDFGDQYRSAIFYADDQQRQTALKLIQILQTRGVIVATELESANEFWPAESYHQDYYGDNGKTPYCHAYQKRF